MSFENIMIFFNDLSDTKHLLRLFKKYSVQPNNYSDLIATIKSKATYCENSKKLTEYYLDCKYVSSVKKYKQEQLIKNKELCKELYSKISEL